ncbi:MAG: ABC transporter ATP-binding protein [Clostridia bacterium]|nr:ABC transporter ATP-binding protein [Clostridia bacterium]
MRSIEKNFGDVQAVRGASFDLKQGEIHSLIGENGAGKSTMMKLLYGMYDRDGGDISISGESMSRITPKLAIERGVGMVHQEFMLVPELTVLENIILGFEPKKGMMLDLQQARAMVQRYIDQYDMDVQMNKRVNQISVGEAQRVEIIKILSRGANVLILDEPTAVLTPQEARHLFEILENLRRDGKSIVFISHRLNEVMEISDRVTVMRRGETVGSLERGEWDYAKLARMMIGREVFLNVDKKQSELGKPILQVKDLWTSGEKEISKIRGLSMEVRAGEIVGIAGIDGNGQSELIEAIAGLRRVEKGSIVLDGTDVTNAAPGAVRRAGLAHIPEDRNLRGLNRSMSIEDNMIVTKLKQFSQGLRLDRKSIRKYADQLVERYDVRPGKPALPTSALSGGNAQKVVVAREVEMGAKLLVASQPTRGVDIGAIESIEAILEDTKSKGVAVLLVSADLREILSLSDRILVMYEGRITGEMAVQDANEDSLGILMMGGTMDGKEGAP